MQNKGLRSFDEWLLSGYLSSQFLNKLNDSEIVISDLKEDKYNLTFKSEVFYRKSIRKLFPKARLVRKKGLFAILESLLRNKTTLIALFIAIGSFSFLSNRIFILEIEGDYPKYEQKILEELTNKGIKKYATFPNNKELKEIEEKISDNVEEQIEFLEIKRKGVTIQVRYSKRRSGIVSENKDTSFYATKDGMIRYFSIQSGNIMVKRNQYVRKGDLLVSNTILTTNNEEIKVPCSGQVYASTWYIISIEYPLQSKMLEVDYYLELVSQARSEISNQLSDGESIEAENILQFKKIDSKMVMKIHFTLLEDITK